MNRFIFTLTIILSVGFNASAQQKCIDPDIRSTIEEKYREIGTTHPGFLESANIILCKNSALNTQWIGLCWQGVKKGALLAYDCKGNLLDIEETGGVKSVQFFNGPNSNISSVIVEDIATGTGRYLITYRIFSLINGKIVQIWDHTAFDSIFMLSIEDGVEDSFEINPNIHDNTGCKKIAVEGVRKIYPAKEGHISFRLEKLSTESYCWRDEENKYVLCK